MYQVLPNSYHTHHSRIPTGGFRQIRGRRALKAPDVDGVVIVRSEANGGANGEAMLVMRKVHHTHYLASLAEEHMPYRVVTGHAAARRTHHHRHLRLQHSTRPQTLAARFPHASWSTPSPASPHIRPSPVVAWDHSIVFGASIWPPLLALLRAQADARP